MLRVALLAAVAEARHARARTEDPTSLARQLRLPREEVFFNALIRSLAMEGSLPPGHILDVGANDGQWSCMYAKMDGNRTVVAVEPFVANVRHLHKLSQVYPNIEPHQVRGGCADARTARELAPLARSHNPILTIANVVPRVLSTGSRRS